MVVLLHQYDADEFYDHLVGTNSGRRDDATASSVTH